MTAKKSTGNGARGKVSHDLPPAYRAPGKPAPDVPLQSVGTIIKPPLDPEEYSDAERHEIYRKVDKEIIAGLRNYLDAHEERGTLPMWEDLAAAEPDIWQFLPQACILDAASKIDPKVKAHASTQSRILDQLEPHTRFGQDVETTHALEALYEASLWQYRKTRAGRGDAQVLARIFLDAWQKFADQSDPQLPGESDELTAASLFLTSVADMFDVPYARMERALPCTPIERGVSGENACGQTPMTIDELLVLEVIELWGSDDRGRPKGSKKGGEKRKPKWQRLETFTRRIGIDVDGGSLENASSALGAYWVRMASLSPEAFLTPPMWERRLKRAVEQTTGPKKSG